MDQKETRERQKLRDISLRAQPSPIMIVSFSLVPHFDTERQMLRFVYTLTQSHLRNGGVRRIFPLFVIRIPLHLGSSYLNITRVLLLKLFLCCSLCNGIFFCNFRGNDLLLYIYLRVLILYHEFFALSLISAPNVFSKDLV